MKTTKKLFTLMLIAALLMQAAFMQALTAFAYSAGDVVINEIAWAGTADGSGDEWIELYNTTTSVIDLSGWYIEDDTTTVYAIASGAIEPHGYFLIEDSEEAVDNASDALIALSFANAGDSLVLKDADELVIDTVNAGGGAWYAGDSDTKASMERVDPAILVDSADNWASALSGNGATGRDGGAILGTPGSANSNYGGSGPIVGLIPHDFIVNPGDQLTVSVEIGGVTDLYAYGFEINYDPLVLNFSSASEGDFLKVDGADTAFNADFQDDAEGILLVGNARLLNPPTGVDGSGNLCDLVFDVVGSSGNSTSLSFAASSFVSDVVGDVPVQFTANEIIVGGSYTDAVINLQIVEGRDRYTLELSWLPGASGASYYIVKSKTVDGTFVVLGEVTEPLFVDEEFLIPAVYYDYQIIAVKDGIESAPVEMDGVETRGILGDLDRSDRVDGKDIELLARSYGSEVADEEYNPLNDTTFDGIIDGNDLIDIGCNFGMLYW